MSSWTSPLRVFLLSGLALLTMAGFSPIAAQVSAGGSPPSFQRSLEGRLPSIDLPVPDLAAYLAEDEQDGELPYRFGAPIPVRIDMQNAGEWMTLPKGDRVWRLRLVAPGAHSLNIQYDHFRVPVGAEFFLYNDDQTQVIGAFTEFNNREDGTFATQPLSGDAIVLEYHEPASVAFAGEISLESVVYGYRNLFGLATDDRAFGDSGSCNNNVNCPVGAAWEGQSRGVAMILTSGGSRICSGSLVNNTALDQTQYFLTADHCGLSTGSYIFMFNYESPSCSNVNGPTTDTVQGCTLRASNSDSDFALVELTESIPASYGVYYSGWSNVDTPATNSVGIHHPAGDIKKISFDDDPTISDRYLGTSGVANSHWKVTQWDDGTTEGGSSGSPLFDQNHRITGQLHGGYASCSSLTADWYGKFSLSWNNGSNSSTRLSDWLDPLGSGASVLDGLDTQAPPTDPVLGLQGINVLDGGDGALDPGETANLVITLLNSGAGASGISGTLSESSSYVNLTDNSGSWPNLAQGASGDNSGNPFSLTVAPGTPIGHVVNFSLQLSADGGYSISLPFSLPVGLIIEGFESGDFSVWDWSSSGAAPWTIVSSPVHEGAFAAKAGAITHSQTSTMTLDLHVTEAGTIGFTCKVSSESNYDYLRFYIDGSLQDEWDGEIDWTSVSYSVTPGAHSFSWSYVKDGSVNTGSDTAWIDSIILPPVGPAPEADITVSPLFFDVTVPVGGSATDQLTLGNTGDANLNWSLSFTDTTPPVRSVEGSTITSDITEFQPGDNLNLTLSLYNASTDVEWIEGALMDLPAGVTLVYAGGFIGGSGGELFYTGSTGDGITATWFAETSSGWGVIRGGETGVATVQLSVDAGFAGDISIPWTIQGDIYGDDPHSVSSTLVLTNLGPAEPGFLTWVTGSGTIAPAGSEQVDLLFSAGDRLPGVYTGQLSVHSNDPDESPFNVPVSMTVVNPTLDPVTDLQIDLIAGQLSLSWTAVAGATSYLVFENIDAGGWALVATQGTPGYPIGTVPADQVRVYQVVASN